MSFFSTKPRGGRTIALLSGLGIGAAVMYVLDPQGGRRRRAVARDKAVSLANKTSQVVGARSRDLGNRAKGAAAEVRSALGKAAREDQDNAAEGRPPSGERGPRSRSAELQEDGGL
jgi:hypothetical protein